MTISLFFVSGGALNHYLNLYNHLFWRNPSIVGFPWKVQSFYHICLTFFSTVLYIISLNLGILLQALQILFHCVRFPELTFLVQITNTIMWYRFHIDRKTYILKQCSGFKHICNKPVSSLFLQVFVSDLWYTPSGLGWTLVKESTK